MSREERCIVYAHGNDWDGVRARQRYLMEALSEYIPIIYLDGSWDSRGKVTISEVAPNVTVVRGLARIFVALKLRNMEQLSPLWGWWHARWIRRKYKKIIFFDAENWLRPYRFMPYDALVFDCIDPCFDRSAQVLADFDLREAEILKAATVAFATADTLLEVARKHNPNVTLINNACSPDEYAQDLLDSAPRPDWWPGNERPVAAYLGSIDWRYDFEVSQHAAETMTEVNFVIAGNILGEVSEKAAKLAALPNVTMPGRISVEDGRYLLAKCDAGLIPFIQGEMNDAINPVKMYAYAFLGKPIAGTSVHELVTRPEIASTGSTPEEFAAAVSAALKRTGSADERRKLREFALRNTWKQRAEQAWQVIQRL